MCKLAFKCYAKQNNALLLYDDPIAISESKCLVMALVTALVTMCFCGGNKEGGDLLPSSLRTRAYCDLCGYYPSKWGSHRFIFNLMVFQTQRQHKGFSPLAFLHCSHRHAVFSSSLAINISWLFREDVLPCAYLCVDLWGIKNCSADLLGQLFKGKWEFVLFPPLTCALCYTLSSTNKFSVFSLPRKVST